MSDDASRPDAAAVRDLAERIRGDLLVPDSDGYDEARTVWNGMVDRRPALVARCRDTTDVRAAVDFARTHDLLVAVHGGGHNVAGNAVCEGGVMVDLSPMRSVRVVPEARTATVAAGATVADLDRATQAHGLATPGGIVSTTGVAGLTLGGGWGWLSRSRGLAVDNLLSAEVVTADGEVVGASEDEHPDLFWGLRGGGGNFGVVTSFAFQLHDVGPTVLGGVLVFPFEVAGDILRFHREFTATAPEELCCYASVRTAPSEPFVPEEIRGELVATAYLCYSGDVEAGEEAIRPLREFHPPLLDLVEPRPYAELQQLFDGLYESGFRNYWKSQFVDDGGLPDAAIDRIVAGAADVPSPYTSVVVEHLGGAISRVDPDATAFPHRDAGYAFNVFARWAEAAEDERQVAWARQFFGTVAPFLDDGVYVNFLGREGDRGVRAAFGDNYDRLVAVKNRYDPDNLFRMNQNVAPT